MNRCNLCVCSICLVWFGIIHTRIIDTANTCTEIQLTEEKKSTIEYVRLGHRKRAAAPHCPY